MFEQRRRLYDRLEECLDYTGPGMQEEIDHILEQLRIRTGVGGSVRKDTLNHFFKQIIDMSFPNIVKFIFLEIEKQDGLFEKIDEEKIKKI